MQGCYFTEKIALPEAEIVVSAGRGLKNGDNWGMIEELAEELGFSLGKLNYCIKALQSKGLIKIRNFQKNPNKINYIYVLTPRGIAQKTKLTLNFMKRKMKEFDELKKELKKMAMIRPAKDERFLFWMVLVRK